MFVSEQIVFIVTVRRAFRQTSSYLLGTFSYLLGFYITKFCKQWTVKFESEEECNSSHMYYYTH